jgi:hypothetical protein
MPDLKKEDMKKLPKRNILRGGEGGHIEDLGWGFGGGGKGRKGKINEMGLEEEGFLRRKDG